MYCASSVMTSATNHSLPGCVDEFAGELSGQPVRHRHGAGERQQEARLSEAGVRLPPRPDRPGGWYSAVPGGPRWSN